MPEFTWDIQVVDDGYKVGLFPAIAVDDKNVPHIVYLHDGEDNLRYARLVNDRWAKDVFRSPHVDGFYPDLVFDHTGKMHIIRYIIGNNWLAYMQVTEEGWDVTSFIPNVNVGATSLALDNRNVPLHHILYYEKDEGKLIYARYRTSGWRIQTAAEVGGEGVLFPLVLDQLDQPHIAYYDPAQGLVYATKDIEDIEDETAWFRQVVDEGMGVGLYPSLVLDSDGYPHISYHDQNLGALKYTAWNGSAWEVMVVDDDGNVGDFTSLAVDPAGYRYISYHDIDNDNLKFAIGKLDQWQITTVDNEDNVGTWNDLALDNSRQPHIAYYDSKARILKYALGNFQEED